MKRQEIYFFRDITIEKIVQEHIATHNSLPKEYGTIAVINGKFQSVIEGYITNRRKKRKVSEDLLYHKYVYLIHRIISNCCSNKEDTTRLNSKILQQVVGDVYVDMLRNLENMQLISLGFYIPKKHSRLIELTNTDCDSKMIYTKNIDQYLLKEKKLLNEYKDIKQNEFINRLGKEFYDNYTGSLSLLKAPYFNEAHQYIIKRKFKSFKSQQYYLHSNDKIKAGNFKIRSIDCNNRIYTDLTNTPSILKNYMNIKFSVDISNSHPLLFAYFIIKKYNIRPQLLTFLYNMGITGSTPIHYDGAYLCNSLNYSGIIKDEDKKIPMDVIEYIFKTSKGLFWNDFKDEFKFISRKDVKINLFREVFYSATKMRRWKKFGMRFKTKYPTINSFIDSLKCKNNDKLPNQMMKLESKIFHQILKRLFQLRYKVISIHDAIVVINTEENITCTPELVEEITKDVYMKFGLNPSVSTDYFNPDYGANELQKTENNKEKVNSFFNDISLRIENANDPDIDIISDIYNGIIKGDGELIVENEKVAYRSF